jgi:putative DNA modification/repair radical SAM protein
MMPIQKKLEILADAAKYDASCASSGVASKRTKGLGSTEKVGICHSYTPDGRCVSLLKILLTNICVFDCAYCINRVSSSTPRARFTPDEVVKLTIEFYKRNYIEGLFLSSGVQRDPDATMAEMIQVAKTLRVTHQFAGYIHLKAVAGASPESMRQAGRWADRLSANIELPTQRDMDQLAPAKHHTVIESAMDTIKSEITLTDLEKADGNKDARFAPGGQSTQLIVGATPSSDSSIIATASRLYDSFKLRRVYYSAFSPIPDSDPKLPSVAPPLIREHRLYQADWLMRYYGFQHEELTTPAQPNLPLDIDPKLSWALRHPGFFPIDVNRAPKKDLLRVPGLGVRNVLRILKVRDHHALTWNDLRRMHVPLDKSKYFLLTADSMKKKEAAGIVIHKDPLEAVLVQRSLFESDAVTLL